MGHLAIFHSYLNLPEGKWRCFQWKLEIDWNCTSVCQGLVWCVFFQRWSDIIDILIILVKSVVTTIDRFSAKHRKPPGTGSTYSTSFTMSGSSRKRWSFDRLDRSTKSERFLLCRACSWTLKNHPWQLNAINLPWWQLMLWPYIWVNCNKLLTWKIWP